MKPTSWPFRVLRFRFPSLLSTLGTRVDMLVLIIGAMVTLYGLALLLQPEAILNGQPGLSPGGLALYQLGMTSGAVWELGWWWTVVPAIYLHGGLVYLVTSVLYVYALGVAVVDIYGHARMFVLFNVAGVSGFLASNVVSGTPSIGPSGAYIGLAVGLLLYGRRSGASAIAGWLWWCCVAFVIFVTLASFALAGLNGWANVGGLVGGWIAALLLYRNDESSENMIIRGLQIAFVIALVVGVSLSFLQVTSSLGE